MHHKEKEGGSHDHQEFELNRTGNKGKGINFDVVIGGKVQAGIIFGRMLINTKAKEEMRDRKIVHPFSLALEAGSAWSIN